MMKPLCAGAALLALVACGDGNPFTGNDEEETVETTPVTEATSFVPALIANDLDSISFNAANNTLVVEGLTQDGVPLFNDNYELVTDGSIVADGFTVFTAQNDPLGRHATAFVASREGVQAGVVMTGGQFNYFFGGSYFDRDGTYVAPTGPESRFDVTYVGRYAAGVNVLSIDTNLLTPDPSLDPDVNRPDQTAFIRGLVFINVDLNDLSVEGEIYDRTGVAQGGFFDNRDLVLVQGSLLADGTFSGNIELDASDATDAQPGEQVIGVDIGDFAGVIGGPNGEYIAGGTVVEDWNSNFDNEIEYGVFVLDLCTAASTDPVCVSALQP